MYSQVLFKTKLLTQLGGGGEMFFGGFGEKIKNGKSKGNFYHYFLDFFHQKFLIDFLLKIIYFHKLSE